MRYVTGRCNKDGSSHGAWLRVVAVVLVAFEMTTVLGLRAHYTTDVFTGLVTALMASVLADRCTRPAGPAIVTEMLTPH